MFSDKFRALQREAGLAATSIGFGVTILGKAQSSVTGYYSQAFFSLSVGLERMCKLIVLMDHLKKTGKYPTDRDLRELGHNLRKLMVRAVEIGDGHENLAWRYPKDDISKQIVECLSEFAVATRYYNLDYLVGGNAVERGDPIANWYEYVSKPLMAKYARQPSKAKVAMTAQLVAEIETYYVVMQTAEDGSAIDSLAQSIAHNENVPLVQRYSRLYVLRLVRYLAEVLIQSYYAAPRSPDIPHFPEFFGMFNNDDKYFLSRKTWDIYRP